MKKYTHIFVSLGFSSFYLTIFNIFFKIGILYFLFLFYFFLISQLNDWLDFKFSKKHKRLFLTHSPLSPLLLFFTIFILILFSFINIILGIMVSIITHLIFIIHFFLDLLNPSGVPLLSKRKFSLNFIKYDDKKWNFIFSLSGIIWIIFSFLIFLISTFL